MARKPVPKHFIPPTPPLAQSVTPGVLEYGQEQMGKRRSWLTRKWRYFREEAGDYVKYTIMGLPVLFCILFVVLVWVARFYRLFWLASH